MVIRFEPWALVWAGNPVGAIHKYFYVLYTFLKGPYDPPRTAKG